MYALPYRSGDGTVSLGGGKPTGWSPFFARPAAAPVPVFGFGGAITRTEVTPEEAREGAGRILRQQQQQQQAARKKGEPRRLVVDLVAQEEDKEKDEPVIVSLHIQLFSLERSFTDKYVMWHSAPCLFANQR